MLPNDLISNRTRSFIQNRPPNQTYVYQLWIVLGRIYIFPGLTQKKNKQAEVYSSSSGCIIDTFDSFIDYCKVNSTMKTYFQRAHTHMCSHKKNL